jgi:enamine deaminase RidA (YjgF/YER057c/UK114 family)
MNRTATTSDKLAPPASPYSHVVEARRFVYTAGLGPQAATGAVPDGIRGQADQAIRNLETALAAVGLTLADVIKTTVHLASGRGDFTASTGCIASGCPKPLQSGPRWAASSPESSSRSMPSPHDRADI